MQKIISKVFALNTTFWVFMDTQPLFAIKLYQPIDLIVEASGILKHTNVKTLLYI